MKSPKAIGLVFYYFILVVAALFFLFPFLWMFVTSFKVSGTGDKFSYIPVERKCFADASVKDFEALGFNVAAIDGNHFHHRIANLYSGSNVPDWKQIQDFITEIMLQDLSASKLEAVKASFSPQYDLNQADSELFQKLGFSHRDTQIIINHRKNNGEFDNSASLVDIPLLNSQQLKLLSRWHAAEPNILLRLDEQSLKEELLWTDEDVSLYRNFRAKFGISTTSLIDFAGPGAIKALGGETLEKANRLFFSNKLYTLSNYKKILTHNPRGDDFTFANAFSNSLLVSVGTGLLTILLCVLGGYVFAKKRFTGKKYLYVTFWASMMIPGMMFIVPQYVIITKLGWINTLQGMIIPHTANIFGLYLMKQYIEQIPHSLFEAAVIDGASELDLFKIIIIPLTMPILATLFLMTFLAQWSNFLWQLIVNTPDSYRMTLPVTLSYLKGQHNTDWTTLMAGSALMLLPIIILFLATQKHFVSGMTAGAVKE